MRTRANGPMEGFVMKVVTYEVSCVRCDFGVIVEAIYDGEEVEFFCKVNNCFCSKVLVAVLWRQPRPVALGFF